MFFHAGVTTFHRFSLANSDNNFYINEIFDTNSNPVILVECKAPSVAINKNAFDQIAKYNFNLKAKFLFVTNGINHYCCKINYNDGGVEYLQEIPNYIAGD